MHRPRRNARCLSAVQPTGTKSYTTQRPRLLSAKDIRATMRITRPTLFRSRYAYFTLVSTNECLPGALLLGWSLKETGTVFECVAMVVPDIGNRERNLLRKVYDNVVAVDPIKTCRTAGKVRHLSAEERATYCSRMTKCNVFKFIEYEKVLFLDSASFIMRNIDEIFEMRAPAGISSLVDSQSQSKFHGIGLSKDHILKSLQLSRGIRGHLLLLCPSLSIYHFCRSNKPRYKEMHFIQPDEQFLTGLFQAQWTHIHSKFALVPWQANRTKDETCGVYFEGLCPWKDDCKLYNEVHQWRQKAINMCKDNPHLRTIFDDRNEWFSTMESVS